LTWDVPQENPPTVGRREDDPPVGLRDGLMLSEKKVAAIGPSVTAAG
jgi:hypothetical protein